MAEGNGLLNRRTGIYLYRGFESRPLRYIDDSQCQEGSRCNKNTEVTTNKAEGESTLNEHPKVPTVDSTEKKKVTYSDKLDNKLTEKDSDLAVVVRTTLITLYTGHIVKSSD